MYARDGARPHDGREDTTNRRSTASIPTKPARVSLNAAKGQDLTFRDPPKKSYANMMMHKRGSVARMLIVDEDSFQRFKEAHIQRQL